MKYQKIYLILGTIILFFVPSFLFSQTTAEQQKAVDWAQGGNVLEDWFMKDFLSGYKSMVWAEYATFIDTARILGGAMALIYFAIKAYEMMTGDKQLEILPLLRPFGLCLVIIYWGAFIDAISVPTTIVANVASQKYEAQQQRINKLRISRATYQYAMVNSLYKVSAETSLAADQSSDFMSDPLGSISSTVKDGLSAVVNPILELKEKFNIAISLAITQCLEILGLWILRIAVYSIFMIQIIYSGVLIMLGPFSVAMSILPMFKESFSTWISRFISVQLYLGVAFIILFVCGILQEFALTSEIQKFKEIVTENGDIVSMEKLMYLRTNGIMSFGVVIVTFLISAISIFTVPSISTWIVSTSGATSAVSTMGRGASTIARIAKGF
ncbi:plasmid transfer protein [Flavobacterium daejeonense]|uniref:plasmid transfer protein n=1 Tax=Flavobacterium daejeonense TaxID=350893 RepID=UPI00047CCB6D|nr:plasmid transfer protein [Flavobacterium daejeonense]